MKKIAICTAIAAICAAPMVANAGADFYGQLRYSINSVDQDAVGDVANDGLTGRDNVSLFGFKASSEGDGIKAFVHLQAGANADGDTTGAGGRAFAQRFYFGGLKGSFGTVAYGRMTNAYKMPGFKMDPFYNLSKISVSGAVANGGASYGASPLTNGFNDNALQYTSNAIGDIKINVGLYIDDNGADEHAMGFGAEYNKGGIKAGLQMISNGQNNNVAASPAGYLAADGDAMRIYGGYKAGNMSLAASFETVDDSATTDATFMQLVGKFKVSAETEVAATIGTVSGDAGTATAAYEGSTITAGIFQTVAPKTQVYASTSMASMDTAGAAERSVISFGAIHKF